MRKLLLLAAIVLVCTACDPQIRRFEITPQQSSCAAEVTISWKGDADGLRLRADPAIVPPLPETVDKEGTMRVAVQQTTQFSLSYPGAGHRELTVTINGAAEQTLVFNGTCGGPGSIPTYGTVSLAANVAPGTLTQIRTNANFPIEVTHAGETISLSPGGGPIGPLPQVAAAGAYTIVIPGKPGLGICESAQPGAPAPEVRVFVTGSCPTL